MKSILLTGLSKKATLKDIKTFFKGCKITNIQTASRRAKIIIFKSEIHATNALKYDKTQLLDKVVSVKLHDDTSKRPKITESENGINGNQQVKRKQKVIDPPAKDVEEEIKDTCRLFVRKIDFTASKEDVTKLFEPFGTLTEVSLPYDPVLKQICGYGFITYELASSAINAFRELHAKKFMSHKIFITAGKDKPEPEEIIPKEESNFIEGENEAVDKQEEAPVNENISSVTKEDSINNTLNNLFIDSDTMKEVVAHETGISKSETDGQNKLESLSINMKQTQVSILKTLRKFLRKNQIDLDDVEKSRMVSRNKPRSFVFFTTKFLVKNLPFNTDKEELEEFFKQYNGFVKVELSKYGLLALIEFDTLENTNTAYLKSMHMTLKEKSVHIQWVPMMNEERVSEKRTLEDKVMPEASEPKKRKETEEVLSSPKNPVSKTLHIKNISFETTYEQLIELFSKLAGFISLKLPTKASGSHKGYALCEFESNDCAQAVMQQMGQGIDFMGRKLVLKMS